MEAVVITPESSPPAAGPYSPALKVGEWVFLSGQGGFDPRSGQHYRAADRTNHSQYRRGPRRRRLHPARCRFLSRTSERLVALCIIQRHISEAFSGAQTGTHDGGSVSGARDAGGNYGRRSGCEKRVRAIALSTMDLGLAGKKALISGSTAGIGFAIASRLAAEQSEVIISGRTEQRVDRAIQEIKRQVPGARVSGIPGDLSSPEVALAVTDRFPDLDIVVNNLGIFEVRPFPEISDEEWERVLQTNLFSGIRLGLPAAHAFAKPRTNHFYLQRVRAQHSEGNDSLRRNQDGASRPGARNGGADRRQQSHGEHDSGGPYPL